MPLIVRSGNRVMLAPGMLDTLSASLLHRQDNFWVFDEREIKYAPELSGSFARSSVSPSRLIEMRNKSVAFDAAD
jgi:hypothetical protein